MEPAPSAPEEPPPDTRGSSASAWWQVLSRRRDLVAYGTYALLAIAIVSPLWRGKGTLAENRNDTVFFEYMLVHGARVFTHGDHPFFADQMNAPYGVNLMANTAVLAFSLPLAPLTLLFGAAFVFKLLLTVGLATTAGAWYYVMSRHLVKSWLAAFAGAGLAGFGPGMISQAVGHPNIINQALVPFLVLCVLRLRQPDRWLRNGLTLAALVIVQVFINEEVLFLTVLVMAVFVILYAVQRWSEVRPLILPALKTLGLTTVVAGAALAYPLWYQFLGPTAYHGLRGMGIYSTDLYAVFSLSQESAIGTRETSHHLSTSVAEQNTFLGPTVILLFFAAVLVLFRSAAVRSLAVVTVLFWALSLGPVLLVDGRRTERKGPWAYLETLPLLDSVVPTRMGLTVLPLVAVVIALLIDRARVAARWRPLFIGLVALALVPIAPTPLPVVPEPPPPPQFITSGEWRNHVPKDGVVWVALPLLNEVPSMEWQLAANLEFTIVGGYFLAPDPFDPEHKGRHGTPPPDTANLVKAIVVDGGRRPILPYERDLARKDLRAWGVTTVMVDEREKNADNLASMLDDLFQMKGTLVQGVWVWDVRPFVAA